ncbi:MAG: ChbG/HpnK family deacetylase, partial [Candidatus Acidiferrales bacterium]
MKRLIVNADDFGYTRGVNAGIVRAFREGIVTSTTLMAN